MQQIIKLHWGPWAYHAQIWGLSGAAVGSIADRHGLHRRIMRCKPWLSPRNIQRQQQWAQDNIQRDWRPVIFTDESSVELGGTVGRQRTSRQAGEAYLPKHIQPTFQSNRQSLMVWGAIAYNHKFPLVRIPLWARRSDGKTRTKAEGLNGQRYTDMILKGPLGGRQGAMRQLEREGWPEVLVVKDGAPAHKAKVAREARAKLKIKNLDHPHPASSPDLNAIENIWWLLKSWVANIAPRATSLDQLWAHVQRVWEDINIEDINNVIESMEQRRADVQRVKGYSTHW